MITSVTSALLPSNRQHSCANTSPVSTTNCVRTSATLMAASTLASPRTTSRCTKKNTGKFTRKYHWNSPQRQGHSLPFSARMTARGRRSLCLGWDGTHETCAKEMSCASKRKRKLCDFDVVLHRLRDSAQSILCDFCGKVFHRFGSLKAHLKLHSNKVCHLRTFSELKCRPFLSACCTQEKARERKTTTFGHANSLADSPVNLYEA